VVQSVLVQGTNTTIIGESASDTSVDMSIQADQEVKQGNGNRYQISRRVNRFSATGKAPRVCGKMGTASILGKRAGYI
jgi:hypothetical protein